MEGRAVHGNTHTHMKGNCFVIFINKRHAIAALFSTMPNSTEDLSPPPLPIGGREGGESIVAGFSKD